MHLAVYAIFVADAVMVLAALIAADHLHPRTATRLLTATAVVVAGSWIAALGVLAAAPVGGLIVAVDLDQWPRSLSVASPVPRGVGALALAGVVLTLVRVGQVMRHQARGWRARRDLRLASADTELLIVDSPTPIAFALPGRPARIVASPAMLRALDADDRRVLFAHERAHLRLHHHLYQAAVYVGAAISPVLIPLRVKVRFSMERWADEEAAAELGGRQPVARALARAGLAATTHPAPSLAFGATGVPARVEALLGIPPTSRRWPVLWPGALGLGAVVLVAEAIHDLERLFELAVGLSR
ncbi:MAG: M48 family metalloprotease [Actinomycetota bacterium]|nr:M48 family metalloprotease [Actinomycetota bacterium]